MRMIWRKHRNQMENDPASEATRRDALKAGGGLALAALALAGAGGRLVAQESSPAASPAAGEGLEGRYVVVRVRKLRPDASAEELIDLIREGFLPLIREVPGFVSYVAVANPETRDQFSVGIYADKAGADESTRLAAEWGAGGAADLVEGDPVVAEGVVDIAAEANS